MANETYLRPATRTGYCPGFRLWDVLGTDSVHYLVDGDSRESAELAVYFGSGGAVSAVSVTLLGDNPDADEWERMRTRLSRR